MIQLTAVQKTYSTQAGDIQALKGIDLTIRDGEIFGMIGKSGAGKSTLIRCLNMLERPTSGSIMVEGQEITALNDRELREVRKKIGMIFQHFNLLSCRTVFDNVAFPLELAGWNKEQIRQRVDNLLHLVGLADKSRQYPAELSGGQKQRVGIARALANKPQVLLCDEATSALDPQTTKAILDLLQDINRKLGLTIVLITHEMQVIKEICHQVAVMEDGRIIEQGPVLQVFSSPQTATCREFISSIIQHDLPDALKDAICLPSPFPDCSLVLRIAFMGDGTEEAAITAIVREYNMTMGILYAKMDYIQGLPFGVLFVSVSGDNAKMGALIDSIQTQDISIEVMGYVARHAAAVH